MSPSYRTRCTSPTPQVASGKASTTAPLLSPLLTETCLLGAVDAHPSGRVLVGSGEVNSSRSSYAGDGVYLSDDHGATWRHAGLEGSHHIGRVIIDRVNPDRMWVAALGELYSDNLGGALYRTTDGGTEWEAVLTLPGVGFVDTVADETDADHLLRGVVGPHPSGS